MRAHAAGWGVGAAPAEHLCAGGAETGVGLSGDPDRGRWGCSREGMGGGGALRSPAGGRCPGWRGRGPPGQAVRWSDLFPPEPELLQYRSLQPGTDKTAGGGAPVEPGIGAPPGQGTSLGAARCYSAGGGEGHTTQPQLGPHPVEQVKEMLGGAPIAEF